MNNYETLEQCQGAAITGACCYRQYSLKVEDVIVNAQNEEFGCKVSTRYRSVCLKAIFSSPEPKARR